MKSNRSERELLFEEFVQHHTNLLYYVANSWCHNPAEAEELVQEAFLRAYVKFDTFTMGTNFKAWILKILRNIFLDAKRKNRLPQTVSLEGISQEVERESSKTIPSLDLENKEIFYDLFSDEIVRILQKLPEEYQFCLLLCDVEEMSYQEIADIFDCPIGTIRSRIHRGRILFQEQVKNYARQIGYLKEPKK